MSAESLQDEILGLTQRAAAAAAVMGEVDTAKKNAWLLRVVERLEAARETIMEANRLDMQNAREKGVSDPLVNRLGISEGKWADMLQGVRDVVALPDPVGRISDHAVRPNGIRVGRMSIPLGVIAMIYEARPNVTVDSAVLCLKAGNAVVLRGGSEAIHSNLALGAELRAALADVGLPEDAVVILPTTDRAAIDVLLKASDHVDLIIPRGGNALIKKVMSESTIPVIAHDAGVCHVYLDATAQREMAVAIVRESKIRQMPVCNAVETLLCHEDAIEGVLIAVLDDLDANGVEIRGDARVCEVWSKAKPATEDDWSAEFLAPILAVRVVSGMDQAIEHIRHYGSDHTEVIVTESYAASQEWLRRVNSSTVGVNCSTGFADGFELGLGAEIGISTSRLHCYGPMGLEGLTTKKFVINGDGQLRG